MRNKKTKRQYHVRNWSEYNAALIKRGSLTVWVEEGALLGWLEAQKSGRRGASRTYSEAAIEAVLLLKAVYHLPLRGAQGFAGSVLALMGLVLPVPHFSTLSRRQVGLELVMPRLQAGGAMHLVVDSTGCKVYGEGEWKVRVHGASKRRAWRKLHLGVDEQTGEIVAAVLSTNNVSDGEVLPQLLEQVQEPIAQLSGDGGYDQRPCYELLQERRQEQGQPLRVTIPHVAVRGFGSMATVRSNDWHVMRICGRSGVWGAYVGSRKAVTTGAHWQKPRWHATNEWWEKSYRRESFIGNAPRLLSEF